MNLAQKKMYVDKINLHYITDNQQLFPFFCLSSSLTAAVKSIVNMRHFRKIELNFEETPKFYQCANNLVLQGGDPKSVWCHPTSVLDIILLIILLDSLQSFVYCAMYDIQLEEDLFHKIVNFCCAKKGPFGQHFQKLDAAIRESWMHGPRLKVF